MVGSLLSPEPNNGTALRTLWQFTTKSLTRGGLKRGLPMVLGLSTWIESRIMLVTFSIPPPLPLTTCWLQFGEEVGLYFHFLATYAKALTLIAAAGSGFWLFGAAYSPYYSVVLVLWATGFVEYWKIVERKISVRWGTYGAFRVEKLRHDYVDGNDSPLQKDLRRATRVAASIPVILGFVSVLAGILTMLFAIEAFVSRLYAGPLHQHVVSKAFDDYSFGLTTILFVL